MSLSKCQVVVFSYGNGSVTRGMLGAVIDDTRDTNLITRAAVNKLQAKDRWLVSSLGESSVELQVRVHDGPRILPEKFDVTETAPAGLPDGYGIVVSKNSFICHDFRQQGYRVMPTVYKTLTPKELEEQERIQKQQGEREAEYEREKKENIRQQYRRNKDPQT